jgi:hypothetical protein
LYFYLQFSFQFVFPFESTECYLRRYINDKNINDCYSCNLEEAVGIIIIISLHIRYKKIIAHDNYDFCGFADEYIYRLMTSSFYIATDVG